MPERLAFDPIYFADLPIRQYQDLIDLAQLAVSHSTTDGLFPALAIHLRHSVNFDFITLGLYDSKTERVSEDTWKVGQLEKRSESVPVQTCPSGCAWKNQRSVLVEDLATESTLPVFLESLRQLGVRTYYVFPLTTRRRKLGAIGFGSLSVIPRNDVSREFLRRAAAMIALFLDTEGAASEGLVTQSDCAQAQPAAEPGPKPGLQKFDLDDQSTREDAFHEIVGNSAPLIELLRQVKTVAATNATVLLLGETGSGKELVARAIHRLSPRAHEKLITVNCTAIPTELLESELFGHEKGAFTGATNRQVGRLELADKGTLLLDEVGDLPSVTQPKLLRVLQCQEFERLGNNRTVKVDVRLIAATN